MGVVTFSYTTYSPPLIRAEAIIPDLHDKIKNSNFKKSPVFLFPELEEVGKWTDIVTIVKSLLQWRSQWRNDRPCYAGGGTLGGGGILPNLQFLKRKIF